MMTSRISKEAKKCVTATLITGMVLSSGATLAYADNTDLSANPSAIHTNVSGDNGFNGMKYRDVGYISITGEVGQEGNGGFISSGKGDAGGKSYGLSQFTSKGGGASANSFVSWLKKNYPQMGKNFNNAGKAGTASFDSAWKKTYKENPDAFEKAQAEYTFKKYVNPAIRSVKEELGVDFNRSRALLEMIYSTSVQFGEAGTVQVFSNAGITSDMTDKEIVEKCTDEKEKSVGVYKFEDCSKDVQRSVYNRFAREEEELKDIIDGYVYLEGKGATTLDDLVNGSNGETLDDLIDDKNTSNNGVLDDLINDEGSSNNGELDDLVSDEESSSSGALDDLINGEDNSNNGESDDLINDENASNGELDNLVNGEESKEDIEGDSNVEKDDFENGSLDDLVNEDDSKEENQNNSENEEDSLDDLVTGEEDSESSDNDYSNQDDTDKKVENEESTDNSLDLDKEDVNDSIEVDSTEEKEEVLDITVDEIDKEKESIEETLDDLIGESVQEDVSEEKEEVTKEEIDDEDEETQENEVEEKTEGDVSEEGKAVNDAIENPIEVEEAEDVIAKLEKELENNIFGKLFKTTIDIMNSENGVDGVREMYMS